MKIFDTLKALEGLKSITSSLLEDSKLIAESALSLGLSSQAAILHRDGYITDFIRQNAMLGDIYQKTTNGWWVWLGNISQFDPTIIMDGSIVSVGYPSALATYTTQTGTSFDLGIQGKVPNLADGQLQVNFNESNSVFAVFKNQIVYSLALGVIKSKIDAIWSAQGFKGHPFKYFLVSEIVMADSGTMVYSEKSNTKATLTVQGTIPVSGLDVVAGGNFSITSGAESVVNIISSTTIVPLFQAYRRTLLDTWEPMG